MRLGGPVSINSSDPDHWIHALRLHGYTAAYCPVDHTADLQTIQAFARAAHESGIIIAEVGAWSNPLSPNEDERLKAMNHCQQQLALADEIAARCCVNIAGSYSTTWDGPHPTNLTGEAFDRIVDTVRAILDAVRPARTFYTLETMPWMYPDSAESYLRLISAVDRPQFAVHFDPVNLIVSPQIYYHQAEFIQDFVQRLGPFIRSCHVKDTVLSGQLTVHLSEVRPGLGEFNYPVLLKALDGLDPDLPVLLEHLQHEEEYQAAAAYIRKVAHQEGIHLA